MMKNKEKIPSKKSGVQLPEWLHELFPRVSSVAGYKQVRYAHEEASIDWVRKKMAESKAVRALIEELSENEPEIAVAISGIKVAGARSKPGKSPIGAA